MIVAIFYQIKTLIDFWCRRGLNFRFLKLCLGVHKGMKLNGMDNHKRMERNRMYLSKGKEWKIIKWNGIK